MKYEKLTMKLKAAVIKAAVSSGILNLDDIKLKWNLFKEGGHLYEGTSEPTLQMQGTRLPVDMEKLYTDYEKGVLKAVSLGFKGKNAVNMGIQSASNGLTVDAGEYDFGNLGEITATANKPSWLHLVRDDGNPNRVTYNSQAAFKNEKDAQNFANGVGAIIGGIGLGTAGAMGAGNAMGAYQLFSAAHPVTAGLIDAGLTIDGIHNAASDNGVKKTIDFVKDDRYGRAALSGLGDALDIFGGVNLLTKGVKPTVSYFKYLKNRGAWPWYSFFEYPIAHSGSGKRAIELAMRNGSMEDPLPNLKADYLGRRPINKINRRNALNYIFTGDEKALQDLRDLLVADYDGIIGRGLEDPSTNEELGLDIVGNYLYGRPLRFLTSPDLGIHTNYVLDRGYKTDKAYLIPFTPKETYNIVPNEYLDEVITGVGTGSVGEGSIVGKINNGLRYGVDVGGHKLELGVHKGTGRPVYRQQDIWKFNPEDYKEKWFPQIKSNRKKRLLDFGLHIVDEAGTPIITRGPWLFSPYNNGIELPHPERLFRSTIDDIVTNPGSVTGNAELDEKLLHYLTTGEVTGANFEDTEELEDIINKLIDEEELINGSFSKGGHLFDGNSEESNLMQYAWLTLVKPVQLFDKYILAKAKEYTTIEDYQPTYIEPNGMGWDSSTHTYNLKLFIKVSDGNGGYLVYNVPIYGVQKEKPIPQKVPKVPTVILLLPTSVLKSIVNLNGLAPGSTASTFNFSVPEGYTTDDMMEAILKVLETTLIPEGVKYKVPVLEPLIAQNTPLQVLTVSQTLELTSLAPLRITTGGLTLGQVQKGKLTKDPNYLGEAYMYPTKRVNIFNMDPTIYSEVLEYLQNNYLLNLNTENLIEGLLFTGKPLAKVPVGETLNDTVYNYIFKDDQGELSGLLANGMISLNPNLISEGDILLNELYGPEFSTKFYNKYKKTGRVPVFESPYLESGLVWRNGRFSGTPIGVNPGGFLEVTGTESSMPDYEEFRNAKTRQQKLELAKKIYGMLLGDDIEKIPDDVLLDFLEKEYYGQINKTNYIGREKENFELDLRNILQGNYSTGGPLYPFSFLKRIPLVRYANGGHLFYTGGLKHKLYDNIIDKASLHTLKYIPTFDLSVPYVLDYDMDETIPPLIDADKVDLTWKSPQWLTDYFNLKASNTILSANPFSSYNNKQLAMNNTRTSQI